MTPAGQPADAQQGEDLRPATANVDTRQAWQVLAILDVLMGFAWISTDLYLRAMPMIGRAFHAGKGEMEVTISACLAGFGAGQLFCGALADRRGRRIPVAAGLVLFIVGAAGCALAPSAPAMIGLRIVQASG